MVRALPGKHLVLIPLALWAASFLLPAITYGQHDWFFPGENPGILACFMSMVSLYFGLGTLNKVHFVSDSLPYIYFGSLWIVDIWMIRAPFEVSKIEQGRARWLLIALWIGAILPVPLPFVLHRLDSSKTLGIGFYAWLLSLVFMALVMTALYAGLNKTSSLSHTNSHR